MPPDDAAQSTSDAQDHDGNAAPGYHGYNLGPGLVARLELRRRVLVGQSDKKDIAKEGKDQGCQTHGE